MNKKQQGSGKASAKATHGAAAKDGVSKKGTGGQASAPQGPSVEDLFTKLAGQLAKYEYKKAVKTADEILAIDSLDVDALKCKVVALILEDKYVDADAILSSEKYANVDLGFEKAYCLYRRNQPLEALEVLKKMEISTGGLQLQAQIYYRIGNYTDCIKCYEELTRKHKVNTPEIHTNMVAAFVSGGRAKEVPSLMSSLSTAPRNSFDLAYNAACARIEEGKLDDAEQLLLLAKRIGEEALIEEEDLTMEEAEDELAPITVQLAYVQQCQGQMEASMAAYNTVLRRRPDHAPSLAVASNNLIAIRGRRDLFDSLKRSEKMLDKGPTGTTTAAGAPGASSLAMAATPSSGLQLLEELELKLSQRQKEAMLRTRFLLLLLSHKLDQARKVSTAMAEKFPESELPLLLQASLLLQEGKAPMAEALLTQQAGAKGVTAVAQLVRAQAAALAGKAQEAANALADVASVQNRPATVATLVALHERAGDLKSAKKVLESAVAHWDQAATGAGGGAGGGPGGGGSAGAGAAKATLDLLLQESAALHLRTGAHKEAAKLFHRIAEAPSSTPSVRAAALTGLVTCTAEFDPTAAERFEAQLPPVAGVSSLDVDALERTWSAAGTSASGRSRAERAGEKRAAPGEAGADTDADGAKQRLKKKKKRKSKPLYPKGFDPANPGPPPDPERWLPRRERSTFKTKRRDKNKAVSMRGAQGSVSAVSRTSSTGDLGATTTSTTTTTAHKAGASTAEPMKVDKPVPPQGGAGKKKKGKR